MMNFWNTFLGIRSTRYRRLKRPSGLPKLMTPGSRSNRRMMVSGDTFRMAAASAAVRNSGISKAGPYISPVATARPALRLGWSATGSRLPRLVQQVTLNTRDLLKVAPSAGSVKYTSNDHSDLTLQPIVE